MANGHRKSGNPNRGNETRVAPADEDESEEFLEARPNETRLAPADIVTEAPRTRGNETRLGPLDVVTEAKRRDDNETRLGPLDVVTEAKRKDDNATRLGPLDVVTEAKRKDDNETRLGPLDVVTEHRRPPPPTEVPKPAKGGAVRAPPPKPARAAEKLPTLPPLKGLSTKDEEENGPELRTMFATHSAMLAESLRSKLSKKMYGRPHRVMRIDEPEGPSTAGGKLARQPISLVPRKGDAPSLVCGWVDVSKSEAQLRAYESVAQRFLAHHGTPVDIVAEEYDRFVNDIAAALQQANIKVKLTVPDEPVGAVRVTPSINTSSQSRGVSAGWVFILVALAFALGMVAGRMTLTPG